MSVNEVNPVLSKKESTTSETPEQRNERIKIIENEICQILAQNNITYLEWQILNSALNFRLRASSVFILTPQNV